MNPYALAWTLTAAVGAALSVVLLVESILDLRALHSEEQNGRRFRVWGRLVQEFIRLTVHVPFAIIGFLALDSPVSGPASITILILLYGNVSFIANSIVAMVVRRKADSVSTDEAADKLTTAAKEAAEVVTDEAARAKVELTEDALARSDDALARADDAAERTAAHTRSIANDTAELVKGQEDRDAR